MLGAAGFLHVFSSLQPGACFTMASDPQGPCSELLQDGQEAKLPMELSSFCEPAPLHQDVWLCHACPACCRTVASE